MAPRLNKANEALVEKFGIKFQEAPDRDLTRKSKYDELWVNVRALLEQYPGQTAKVRTFTNASAPYQEAKSINNGEHRHFKDGAKWLAVATKSNDEDDLYDILDDDGNPTGQQDYYYALWLTYNGDKVE